VNVPLCVNEIVRSGVVFTAEVTTAESLPVFVSPPPPTEAVFEILAAAPLLTDTVMATTGKLAPAARTALPRQLTSWSLRLHVQPLPEAALGVSPAGSRSLKVMAPLVAAPPTLPAVSVYVPVPPCANGVAVIVSVRSEICVTGLAIVLELSAGLVSPPPAMVAVSETVAGTLAATLTETEITP
jgi:hypothetical protein